MAKQSAIDRLSRTRPLTTATKNGVCCGTLFLATSNGYSKEGRHRVTCWHTIKVWGKDLSHLPNSFIKGSHVLVEGSLVYHSFCDTTGHTRTSAHIKAERIINLDR